MMIAATSYASISTLKILWMLASESSTEETFSGLAFNIQNVADAENFGFDVEALWLPTDDFEVTVGYAYLDSEINQGTILDPDTGAPINISNTRMPFAPESSYFLSDLYTVSSDLGDWSIRGAYSCTDDVFLSVFEDPIVDATRSHGSLDIRVGLASKDDDRWSIALIGENVTDKRWFSSMSDILEPRGCAKHR